MSKSIFHFISQYITKRNYTVTETVPGIIGTAILIFPILSLSVLLNKAREIFCCIDTHTPHIQQIHTPHTQHTLTHITYNIYTPHIQHTHKTHVPHKHVHIAHTPYNTYDTQTHNTHTTYHTQTYHTHNIHNTHSTYIQHTTQTHKHTIHTQRHSLRASTTPLFTYPLQLADGIVMGLLGLHNYVSQFHNKSHFLCSSFPFVCERFVPISPMDSLNHRWSFVYAMVFLYIHMLKFNV